MSNYLNISNLCLFFIVYYEFFGLNQGPHPVVVFMHGSGVSDRDNLWYLHIADYLAQRGIMVLLPDKRGCGKSEGEWHSASFEDFAGDAIAGAKYLTATNGLKISKVGFLGVSQGGKISAYTAEQSDIVDFAINLSGGVVTLSQALAHEISADMRNGGAGVFCFGT